MARCSCFGPLPPSQSGDFTPHTDMTVDEELTVNSRNFFDIVLISANRKKERVFSPHLLPAGNSFSLRILEQNPKPNQPKTPPLICVNHYILEK